MGAQPRHAQPAARDPLVSRLLSRCHFPEPPGPVTLAVSGGADSLALLILTRAAGLDAVAVHVDHGLRPGGAAEAEVVAAAARRYGAGFQARVAAVAPGPNLEARARRARYDALPPGALTGHTADDQAETVLLNLLRGAGLDGLAGMRDGSLRPLLRLRRHETRALCDHVGLVPVADPSNEDPRYRRNRVRHEVLPLLVDVAGRDVVDIVARQAALLSADAHLLEALSAAIDPTDAKALAAAPLPLARRAVRRWLRHGHEQHPPSAADVERVLAVASGDAVACEVAPGRRVSRSGGRLLAGG